jgi:hypothetical protein
LLSAALNATGITWGLPSMLGWAADELTPARVLAGMRRGFAGGWHDPYPAFHFYVLAAAYAPVLATDNRPLADVSSSETGWRRQRGDGAYFALFVAGRLVSLLMALGTLVAVYRAGVELFDRAAAAWAALLMALSLPFVYYAKIANVDLPFTFWFGVAFVAYLRILREHRPRDYRLYAAAAVLAVCAKDQAYGLFVLPTVHIVRALMDRERPGGRSRRGVLLDRRIVSAALVGAGVFVLAQGIVFNPSGFVAHLVVLTGPMNRNLQMFEHGPAGYLAMLALTARLLLFDLGLPAAFAAAAGVALAWRRGERRAVTAIALPCVSYFVFFLCVALVAYDRYLMPLCACLSLAGGYFLARAGGRLAALRAVTAAAVVLVGLARCLSVDLSLLRDSRYAAEAWMAANVPPSAGVTVSGPLAHLPRLHGYAWTQRASLAAARTEWAVLTTDYARAAGEGEEPFATRVARDLGYDVAYRHRARLPWPFDLGPWIRGLEAYTNLHKVNPEVAVLRRRLAGVPKESQTE